MTSDDDTGLTHADVERIVQLVEEGGFGYVRLKSGGLELSLVREGYSEEDVESCGPRSDGGPLQLAGPSSSSPAPVGSSPVRVEEASPGSLVASPMVGIFYRAPGPDSPPYVEVDQLLEPGDTVGLIEVMKMYTAVCAETGGRVAEILVDNGQAVDRGQPLIRIVES